MTARPYGPIQLDHEIREIWDDVFVGYNEDGEPVTLYKIVAYGLIAGNDGYEWSINFPDLDLASQELARVYDDPELVDAPDETAWCRRTPYGSAAWGPEDEWQMACDGGTSADRRRLL